MPHQEYTAKFPSHDPEVVMAANFPSAEDAESIELPKPTSEPDNGNIILHELTGNSAPSTPRPSFPKLKTTTDASAPKALINANNTTQQETVPTSAVPRVLPEISQQTEGGSPQGPPLVPPVR